jgi:hypothetical protein
MAELKRYLYDGLKYKIITGTTPIIVNDQVVDTKQSIPKTIWTLKFGKVNPEIKDAIENIIFSDPNNIFISSPIGPSYYIGKKVDYVSQVASYFMTYVFEYKYHNTFVDKPISYTVEGTDHVLEGGIRIPANQGPNDPVVIIKGNVWTPRKLKFLDTKVLVQHEVYRLFNFDLDFTETAAPLPYSGMFIVGESYAAADYVC